MKQKFLTSLEKARFAILDKEMEIMNFTDIIDISSLIEKYKNDTLIYIVKDDEKIEGVSYFLYNTTDYYDLLMILNDMKSMTQLPKNVDIVYQIIQEEYNFWLNNIGENKNDEQKRNKMQQIERIIKEENEKFRHLKYLKPQIMSSFEVDFKNLIKNLSKER